MIKISKPVGIQHTQHVNALVYGEAGIGKTVLATTASDSLLVAAEPGILSILDTQQDVTEVKSLKDVKEVYTFLKKDNPYQTVTLDSISEIAQVVLSEYKALERDPRQAFMKMAEEIISIIRAFRDLPMNVIFIAKQDRITDELSGRTMYGPLFPGQMLKKEVPYQLDIVMAMRFVRKDGVTHRKLQTEADIQYTAKDRTGKLEKYIDPNLDALFETACAIQQTNLELRS